MRGYRNTGKSVNIKTEVLKKGQEFLGGNELLWIQYFTQGASEAGGEAIKVS